MRKPILSKKERAIANDLRRFNEWKAAPWWRKIAIYFRGDYPSGFNHREDWKAAGGDNYYEWTKKRSGP